MDQGSLVDESPAEEQRLLTGLRAQQGGERRPSFLDGIATDILACELKKVKGDKYGSSGAIIIAQQVKIGVSVTAKDDRLAVYGATGNGKSANRGGDLLETVAAFDPVPTPKANLVVVLAGDDPITVVLDFVGSSPDRKVASTTIGAQGTTNSDEVRFTPSVLTRKSMPNRFFKTRIVPRRRLLAPRPKAKKETPSSAESRCNATMLCRLTCGNTHQEISK